MEDARKFAIQRFATDLLDSIDNLDRALIAVPASALKPSAETVTSNTSSADPNVADSSESSSGTSQSSNQDLINLHSGLKMTEEILMNALKKHGLERYDPIEREGKKFDPNQDEATFFMAQEGKPDGEVFFTQSKGFKLNGRVVRAAKVGVVKNS
jgi:molecular chaperone GrpE